MLKIVLAQTEIKLFKTCIEIVANIFKGPKTFLFMQDRMQFQAMDQGSIFVFFDILKEYFSEYELDQEKIELRVDVEDFKKVLSRPMAESEILILEFNNTNKLQIMFKRDLTNNKRIYQLALHNPEDDSDRRDIAETIKSIPLQLGLHCRPGLLRKAFGDVEIAAEKDAKHLIITANFKYVNLEIKNLDIGMNAWIELPTNEQEEYKILTDDPNFDIKVTYDLEYINSVIKLDDLTSITKFELGTDKPARFTFPIHKYIEFVFVEAPLVKEEDDNDSDTTEFGAE
jgi:DNA polymerase III sliding clamp (beta) subunit (PCNA family)